MSGRELEPLLAELGAAVRSKDGERLAGLLAEDFHGVGFTGRVVDKAGYLRVHLDAARRWQHYDPRELEVRSFGDVALVFGIFEIKDLGELRRSDEMDSQRFTAVAVRREGRWLLLAYQETRIP